MTGQSKPMRLSPWQSAVAGATGAVLANAVVYPLDLFVTNLRLNHGMIGKHANSRDFATTVLRRNFKSKLKTRPQTIRFNISRPWTPSIKSWIAKVPAVSILELPVRFWVSHRPISPTSTGTPS